MEIIKYLLASTVLISISYLVFRLAYRNATRFRQQRFFLIAVLVLSLILPLTGIKIQTGQRQEKEIMTTGKTGANDSGYIINILSSERQGYLSRATGTALKLYLIITAIIISVFAAHFIRIFRLRRSSVKNDHDRFTIIVNPNVESPFSFFRWIFIPKDIEDREEMESIIIHESVHVTQHHSADNLLIGFTAALMWFNPLVWMMKKSFHLIHEYLADEGTIGSAGLSKSKPVILFQLKYSRIV
ncbi:MAG: M56 family metallopeptidase [Bacteroidales bacterium]